MSRSARPYQLGTDDYLAAPPVVASSPAVGPGQSGPIVSGGEPAITKQNPNKRSKLQLYR